jgi:hypothetical protein
MGKRFPIPSFEYDRYKNLDWRPPQYLTADRQRDVLATAKNGSAASYGAYPVQASPAFYERYRLKGDHLHAMMCVLPETEVHVLGRSHAWAIQQALVVDSLDPNSSEVLLEWKTPRPVNTRLGPENGVSLKRRVVYVVCSHRYADYWLVNRTAVDATPLSGKTGFSVISASDDAINDFHACNVSFDWA